MTIPISVPESVEKTVLIVTALRLEMEAVISQMGVVEELKTANDVICHSAQKGNIRYLAAEIGVGNVVSSTETASLITELKPDMALFVGVAGGVKDVDLGDVVIGSKLYYVEGGKETEETVRLRPEARNINRYLDQQSRAFLHSEVVASLEFECVLGPIASGERVVGSSKAPLAKLIKDSFSDAIAVEMEGYGFMAAASQTHINALVIRGISDELDNKSESDESGSQERAAANAASVAFALIDRLLMGSIEVKKKQVEPANVGVKARIENLPLDNSLIFDRPKLTVFLDEFVESERPLAVISATSGIGKTTSMLRWSSVQKTPIFWVPGAMLRSGRTIVDVLTTDEDYRDLIRSTNNSFEERTAPVIVVDAPDESDDPSGVSFQIREFANSATGNHKIIVLARPVHALRLVQMLPEPMVFIGTTTQSGAVRLPFGLELLSPQEVDVWSKRYFQHYEITATLSDHSKAQFRNPMILRLFCETNKSESLGFVTDLSDQINEFVERCVASAEILRSTIDTRWSTIRSGILAEQWIGRGNSPIKFSELSKLGISSEDVRALTTTGLFTESGSTADGISVSFSFEFVADALRREWLASELGSASSSEFVKECSDPTVDPELMRKSRELLVLVAESGSSESELILRAASKYGPDLYAICASSLQYGFTLYDEHEAKEFSQTVLDSFEFLLESSFEHRAKRLLVPPGDGSNHPMGISTSFSEKFRDVCFTIERKATGSELINTTIGLDYPQRPLSINGMSLTVTNFDQTLGGTIVRLMTQLDSDRGLGPDRPVHGAVEAFWRVVKSVVNGDGLSMPAPLFVERVLARCKALGIDETELLDLPKLFGKFDSTIANLTGQARVLYESAISNLTTDLRYLKVPNDLAGRRIPLLKSTGERGKYEMDSIHGLFEQVVQMMTEAYVGFCEANFGKWMLKGMPFYNLGTSRCFAVSDGRQYRVAIVPSEDGPGDSGFVDVSEAESIFGSMSVSKFGDISDGATEHLRSLGWHMESNFEPSVSGSLLSLMDNGTPASNVLKQFLREDLKIAVGKTGFGSW